MASRPKSEVLVYGVNAARAVLGRRPGDVVRVFVDAKRVEDFRSELHLLASTRRPYHVVEADQLERITEAVHHEGICVVARPKPVPTPAEFTAMVRNARAVRLAYLDGVDNPHNLGAILRVAAHFGVSAVLVRGRDEPLTPAARRVAEGGAEAVHVFPVVDPKAALGAMRTAGVTLVATDARAKSTLYEAELPAKVAFLLGAERHGLSDEVRGYAGTSVAIEGTGAVESLNVATAAAVLFAEHARRWSGQR